MKTAELIQPPATARAGTKAFVVVSKFFHPFKELPGIYVDTFGGVLLGRLLELQLRTQGVVFDDGGPARTAVCLTRAIALFEVTDPLAASEALSPILEDAKLAQLFVMGWLDEREVLWRPLWPLAPAFDLNQRMNELMQSENADFKTYQAALVRHIEAVRQRSLDNPS